MALYLFVDTYVIADFKKIDLTFEIPSLFLIWMSSGLSSYSGTSRGFATVIGVFLVFYDYDMHVCECHIERKKFPIIRNMLALTGILAPRAFKIL